MVSVAMMYLFVLEPFLFVKLEEKRLASSIVGKSRPAIDGDSLCRFYMFTQNNRKNGIALDLKNNDSFGNFNPSLGTKIIIHGFLDQVRIADWMHEMKEEFLTLGNFNVIEVDWSSGNSIPYAKAAANTEKVGKEISKLISTLKEYFGANLETFHIIGHSLGSHVAGFVGENIKPIGRITALDPAMCYFSNASPRKRLDSSDAKFVDVIHTDAGGIGMIEPIGHVDFYPNGGKVQPGCTATNYLTSLVKDDVVENVRNLICSHSRAVLLFIESINSKSCQMASSRCESWKDYELGKCEDCGRNDENCTIMGMHTDVSRSLNNQGFYLITAEDVPYCVFEYRLNVIEADNDIDHFRPLFPLKSAMKDLKSKPSFWVTLFGNRGQAEFYVGESNEIGSNSYVFITRSPLGTVNRATLKWHLGAAVDQMVEDVTKHEMTAPHVTGIEVVPKNWSPSNTFQKSVLCASRSSVDVQIGIIRLRSSYCITSVL